MPEFSEISNQSIWALAKHITAIADVLKKELPFDTLTPSCHVEDGTDDFTIGISARSGDSHYSIMIYTHSLDAPPEPKEVYPEGCCAVGALQIFPWKRRGERLWRFVELRNAGWLITAASGCHFQLRTSHF